ncbi:MAG: tRNA (uridine(34)/cytosine(34)/5-carboxymethylaminomethyluridine(34)-2'-O)-methyltransferase TrmL, partial [Bacillales bacterium]|nr:tRNA (uridine(34)/cytosine(34)/5-carboxymethylaminomethyluridine(34)-2'-O)-methyltransferase TrmL [Bacillales bacterium]
MLNIILFQPEKPSNLGNIMRSCGAFNANLIVITPLTFNLETKELKRAGMDYLDVSVVTFISYETFLEKYPLSEIIYVTRYGKKTPNKVIYKN